MKKKKLAIFVLIILIILGLAFLGVNLYMDSLIDKTSKEEEPIKQEEIENNIVVDDTPKAHEVVNIMLVGADNLQREIGRENSFVEERSDVFKIISLDYTDKVIKLTSLDRDIVVWIPDRHETGEFGRFNWAYSFGKAKYALNTINYNLDLDVSKYVTFSFAGFINVIDIIGGVDIELTQIEADAFNGLVRSNAIMDIEAKQGLNHLDGYNALMYARQRYVDSDFNRMERQNKIIKAVTDKMKALSLKEMLNVVNACLPYVTTNLTSDEIKNYVIDLLTFDLNNIQTQTYPIGGTNDVCRNLDSMGGYILRSYSNQVIELHKYIYGTDTYEPSKTIYENEKKTYDTYGEFYEGSNLIP